MSDKASSDKPPFEGELRRLEREVDELIAALAALREENRALRHRQESLANEKAALQACGQPGDHTLVPNIGFDQRDAGQHGDIAILLVTTGRDRDLNPCIDQHTRQMAPNKTGATNEENFLIRQHAFSLVDRLIFGLRVFPGYFKAFQGKSVTPPEGLDLGPMVPSMILSEGEEPVMTV